MSHDNGPAAIQPDRFNRELGTGNPEPETAMEGPASRAPSPARGMALPPPLTVVKLGGSLARDDAHDALLDTIAILARAEIGRAHV